MDKLPDLELEKRISDIEGVLTQHAGGRLVTVNFNGGISVNYNPLTDKAMLWDLRLKHRVEIDDDCKTCRIWKLDDETGYNWVVDYETDGQLPRAMLEVIVEANG